ncbi:flagellar hook-associated protein FlgK [Azonexus sp.]|uniref:flagellar hook-associated protein FlgK n=1 Tax=Azonexus sp. TaxID=1872668 RepID=UPI0027B8CE50|nr:flagellar hook-associated protein FlgK [Azonexus sp.]
MGTGLLSIGVTGIRAAQVALMTTEHNIVNAHTPGYTRQSAILATNISVNTGSGAIGQGVHVTTVKREYDQFLEGRVKSAQTQVSFFDTQFSQLSQIDLMLADPEAGLSPALQEFFTGVQQVASNPSSLPARQSMLTTSQTLVNRFSNLESRLSEIDQQLNGRIQSAVADINAYAYEIADLNQRIVLSQASYGQPANDLLDQRDYLMSEVNKMIKVSSTIDSNGAANVFVGNGQQLVVGGNVSEMRAVASSLDPSRIVVALKTAGGSQELPESLIVGGELGGLVSFRKQSLDAAKNELGRVAVSMSLTFNAQYGLGQDLLGRIDGQAGFEGEFFSVPAPKITESTYGSGTGVISNVKFMPPEQPSPPTYSGSFYTQLQPNDYHLTFDAGGDYTIRRLSDNQSVATGTGTGTVTFDGISLDIDVSGAAGDRFMISPFAEASRNITVNERILADPRMVAAGAPVRTVPNSANTGSMVLGQGVVAGGYSMASLPMTVTATATDINLSYTGAGNWTAIYSNDNLNDPAFVFATSAGADPIPLTDVVRGTLVGFNIDNTYFKVDGRPNAGDTFTIEASQGAAQDGRNALLFAKLQTANTTAGGTASYQTSYARLVADNGIRTREAKVRLASQEAVLKQATNGRDALSAVNLDEEAANLMKYQQAYQAAAKVLEIGGTLFDTIISIR